MRSDITTDEGQVFDKPPAHVDHEKSLRSAVKCGVVGVCPLCGEGWIHGSGRLNRRVYAGEQLHCCRCAMPVVCIPEDPTLRTPEMIENPWKKAERLEKEMNDWKEWGKRMQKQFIALENQLAESRRNFEITVKLLRGTE